MRELDQRLMRRAALAMRKGTPSCYWPALADMIVADRAQREGHLNKPANEINRDLAAGLGKFLSEGVVVHPFKLEAEKVEEIRGHLEKLPVYAGFHIFSSDKRLRPLGDVRQGSSFAGYTADQVLRTPHLVDLFNHPAIVDFVQLALGCVPTLYSVNAWWSFPAQSPKQLNNQFFHRDNDDWRFFTLFLYLSDVDEHSGPHQLIAGSHTLAGTESLIKRAKFADPGDMPMVAADSFSNSFGMDFSTNCERYFRDSIVDITGPAGTIFTANTVAIHRGLMPTKTPRLVAWARYGLGPNSNSIDMEQGPLSHHQVFAHLPDTPRTRYINRLLFEFDRSPDPVLDFPGQNLTTEGDAAAPTQHAQSPLLARLLKATDGLMRRNRSTGD
jgi:hypothetical protein